MSNQYLQTKRELGTILAALNMWAETTPKNRARHRIIATDGGEFDALPIPEVTKLIDRLNMGGYVSPGAATSDPELAELCRQGALEKLREHLHDHLRICQATLRTTQSDADLVASMEQGIKQVGEAKRILMEILRLEALDPDKHGKSKA
jgi:hypothetical protein